ncbi:MAG: type VII secretion protein EssC [Oscillospiraceae bacterium]|nr:type VII secretion protein EssC [Oscillospiraceae bacterium]
MTEFSRQPRMMAEYPSGETEIESPQAISGKPEIQWFQVIIMPLAMIGVTVLVFFLQSSIGGFMSNPIFLVSMLAMTGLSFFASLINLNQQFSKHKKQKKQRDKTYKKYIEEKEAELKIASEQQSRALKQMNPSPNECIERMNVTPGPTCPTDPRIWERTPGYGDFLSFRVGIGTSQAALKVVNVRDSGMMETDPLMSEPKALAMKYEKVTDVPLCVGLRSTQICGIVGTKERTNSLVNNILVQLAANHGYDNVRIVILADSETYKNWEWVRFLPHLWNDSLTARRIICDKDSAKLALDEIHADIKERLKKDSGASFSQYYVFVVEDSKILDDSPLRRYILEPNAALGLTTIFTAENSVFLPSQCGVIVTLKEKTGEVINRVTNEKNIFVPDTINPVNLETAARRISPLRIRAMESSSSLPRSVTLCQMLGESDLTNVQVIANWAKRRTYNGMEVPIGARLGGDLFGFDIHDDVGYGGHGPHGLVAGTTGSGKSELLQSIIISLAINFHPHDIVFVLIDYKGGGMADVFKGIPHLAGIITNLGGNQTNRAMLSINSELKRRQALLAQYSVNHIDKYQRIYYSENRPEGMIPMPHLVMIADEFAELYHEQREFMNELVSAARVGRSLGIHLVLATQKPDGVVDDQIWSNSKFKICLKVQTEADSNGVLKKTDAAFIREPGRAYIQIGNDEIYELIQSTYSGADYVTEETISDEKANADRRVFRLSTDGRQTQIYPRMGGERPVKDEKKNPTQLEIMVEHIANIAEQSGISALPGPWTEPLEEFVYLNEVSQSAASKNKAVLSAAVGIVDDPRGQRRFNLEFDFASDGGLLVYGASGTGKTTLLKTICLALARSYSPDEVNIYIMDMGGAALKMFNGLPHCGGVLSIDQEREIQQFIRFLFRIIEKRKALFEENNTESFVEYRKKGFDLPAAVVMVDGYAPLMEVYDDVDEQITLLSRDAARYGIYFVITGMSTRDIRYKLSTNFKSAVTFELTDKSYSEIVGRTNGVEPDGYFGRGLVKLDKPLEFQAALPEYKDGDTVTDTRAVIDSIAKNETRRAVPIPVMPDKVDFKAINSDNTETNQFFIGLNDSDLSPVLMNFGEYTSFVITGGTGCGKSSLAVRWLKTLKNANICYMDSNGAGFAELSEGESFKDLSGVEMSGFVENLVGVLEMRRKELIEAKKEGRDLSEVKSSWKQIVLAFDRITEMIEDDANYELCKLLTRIVKREQNMKVMVLALDTVDDLSTSYAELVKALKDEQTGLLLASMKEQSLFNINLPYGTAEKAFMFGDGYVIRRSSFAGIRAAF